MKMEVSLVVVLTVMISCYCHSRVVDPVRNGTQLNGRYPSNGPRRRYRATKSITVPVWKSVISDDTDWSPRGRSYLTDTSYHWPHGRIPFIVDKSINGMLLWKINEAINYFNIKTCVKWLPAKGNEENYVVFRRGPLPCWSQVGCVGGRQDINLNDLCVVDTIHEMMHTMGFIHEQTRLDRDCYVTIRQDMLDSNFNYRYYLNLPTDLAWPYDYRSIMHYPSQFGPTPIIWGKGRYYHNSEIGPDYEMAMTDLDLWKVKTMYCGKPHYCSVHPEECWKFENYEKTCKPSYFL